jgi:pyrroline-5-carboxylate reductase
MPESQPNLKNTRLGIVGAGVMAEAMLGGLIAKDLVDPGKVICSHPREARRNELREKYGVSVSEDNQTVALESDVLLLGIKPQVLATVAAELRGRLRDDQLVISILAGATTRALKDSLQHAAVVRSMPNTPSQIGQGVTVWYATGHVSQAQKDLVRTALSALGREFEVHDERQVAMATALSGTGPTYVFLFLEALVDAGVHLGFPRHMARELALDTLVGSGAFAQQSGKHVAELRDMVTSPGGTSAEALYELEAGRFRTVINDAVWASFTRTLELEARLEGATTAATHRNRPR